MHSHGGQRGRQAKACSTQPHAQVRVIKGLGQIDHIDGMPHITPTCMDVNPTALDSPAACSTVAASLRPGLRGPVCTSSPPPPVCRQTAHWVADVGHRVLRTSGCCSAVAEYEVGRPATAAWRRHRGRSRQSCTTASWGGRTSVGRQLCARIVTQGQ